MHLTKKAEKQQSIALNAVEHPEWRQQNLYNLLHWDHWMDEAAQAVLSRPGSDTAGVDGQTRRSFRKNYDRQISDIISSLKTKTYTPLPTKRVYIPKPDGTKRPLGIPALRDRIVQEAIRAALDPIYEAEFSPQSYGFRKGRSTMDAIRHIMPLTNRPSNYYYVIEGDLRSYFDTVNHRILFKLLRRRINDKAFVDLIGKFLKAGVLTDGLFAHTPEGVPQGGVLSPLLSNVYLHEFDTWVANQWPNTPYGNIKRRARGLGNVQYVRYADDFVLLCNGPIAQVREIKEEIKHYLEDQLHLTLNDEKTAITHINAGFDFLGFNIQRVKNHEDRWVTHLRPAAKNIVKVKAKIKEITSRKTTWAAPYTRLTTLNMTVRGWANYYRHTSLASDIEEVSRYAWWSYYRWLRKKFPTTSKWQLRVLYEGVRFNRKRWFATIPDGDHTSTVWQWHPTTREYKRSKALRRGADTYPHPYIQPTEPNSDYRHTQGTNGPTIPSLQGFGLGGNRDTPPEFDVVRLLVLQRDNHTCQKCDSVQNLAVHHIYGMASHKPDDLITYCKPCHDATHRNAKESLGEPDAVKVARPVRKAG